MNARFAAPTRNPCHRPRRLNAYGFWEIDAVQAEVVREVFTRYINDGISIGEIARWLTDRGVPIRTGKAVWDRSSVWGMLRNTAYRGQAAFGKTKTLERHGDDRHRRDAE